MTTARTQAFRATRTPRLTAALCTLLCSMTLLGSVAAAFDRSTHDAAPVAQATGARIG